MIHKILAICAKEMDVPVSKLSAHMKFSETAIDSLEFLELLQAIESEFWTIPNIRVSHIETPADIARELEACK